MSEVLVIGGGAAGLAASIAAARAGKKVTLLEASGKTGAKILASGGGKCNYTNLSVCPGSYYDENKGFIEPLLDIFGAYDAIDFFESIGVYPSIKNGFVYPRSEEAATVLSALLRECEKLKVSIHTNAAVTHIERFKSGFKVFCEDYSYEADKVILAAGSPAGATGALCAYDIAKSFGHSINELSAALTGVLFSDILCSAAGIRTRAKASILTNDEILCESEGEIQLTSYGASGVPVMNISRFLGSVKEQYLVIDFIPETDEEEFDAALLSGTPLTAFFPKKLAALFDIMLMERHPKHYIVKLDGKRSFESAQVTRGGIPICEIDPLTFESKLAKGLFIAGEMLDVDGKCGGYNLHFAWASGFLAGCAAAGAEYKRTFTDADIERWKALDTGSRRSFI